jgi:polyisoprenoid-binding protein YceI
VHKSPVLTVALLAALVPAPRHAGAETSPAAPVPGAYRIDAARSELRYDVRHPLHAVVGTSGDVRGTLDLTETEPWLRLPCRLTAPLIAFTSRNRNRDSNAFAVLAARRFPDAEINLTRLSLRRRPGDTAWSAQGKAEGELTLKGLSRAFSASVSTRQVDPATIEVSADFSFALSDHKIERPALLLIPIDDGVRITAKLVATR